MSTGIRRIRRKMDQYRTDNYDSVANNGRYPRSSRIGGCCGQNTLVGRVHHVEEEIDDLNCALVKQAVALNNQECRLECKADKKCCNKREIVAKRKKNVAVKRRNVVRF